MCRECSAVERGEGEVRGCKRGRVCVCVEGGGSTGMEERVINHVWVTHNEI